MTAPAAVVAAPPGSWTSSARSRKRRFGRSRVPGRRYPQWTLRLVLFHGKRHPRDLSPGDVRRYLSRYRPDRKGREHLCLEQAHAALTFVYHDVLGLAVGELP